MTFFDPLLVPFDGSKHARAAAATARAIARATGVRTALVHAIPGSGELGDRLTVAAHADELLNEEARLFDTPVEVRLVDGTPAAALAVEAEGAGLVIIGTRGRSVLAGVLLGSVARFLLRSIDKPVLAVHAPLEAVHRIVVGVDVSAGAVATTRAARALADATGASLKLVHAVAADPEVSRDPAAFGVSAADWEQAMAAQAEEVFRPLRAIANDGAASVAIERVEFGLPVERLRAVAEAEGAEVVAVGRKGRSGTDVDDWFSVAFGLAVRGPFATLVV